MKELTKERANEIVRQTPRILRIASRALSVLASTVDSILTLVDEANESE